MSEQKINADVASRRHLLKLGAMAAPAVITLTSGSARAATSVLCHVPFPDKGVDENGNPCESSRGGSKFRDQSLSDTALESEVDQGVTAQGGFGGGGGGQDRQICYKPEGGVLTSEQISNGFGIDGIGGGSMEEYRAYVSYLDRVKRDRLAGASCLMSLRMTGR